MNEFETWMFSKSDLESNLLLGQMEFVVLGSGFESIPATRIQKWGDVTASPGPEGKGAYVMNTREFSPKFSSTFSLRYFQVTGSLMWFFRKGVDAGTNMFYGGANFPVPDVAETLVAKPCHLKIIMSTVPAIILAQWNPTIHYDCCTSYAGQTAMTQTEICKPMGTFYNGKVPTVACDKFMSTYCNDSANARTPVCSCMPGHPFAVSSPGAIAFNTLGKNGQNIPRQCLLPTCINAGYKTGPQVNADCSSFCDIVNNVKEGLWTNLNLAVNCDANGIMEAQTIQRCDRPTVTGGIPDCAASVAAGGKCHWKANASSGYKTCSNPEQTCLSNGSWSGGPTSCVKFASCTTPVIPDAATNCTASLTDHGVTCTYTAKPGFQCENTTQTCNDGKWDQASAPVCTALKPCTVPVVPNTLSSCDGNTTVPNGTTCTRTAATGYKCVGGGKQTCINGVWSGLLPSCTQIMCPPKVVNGGVTACLKGSLPGEKCSYAPREPEYVKCVNNEITCGATGNWDTTPKCYKTDSKSSKTTTIVVIAAVVVAAAVGGIILWRVLVAKKASMV